MGWVVVGWPFLGRPEGILEGEGGGGSLRQEFYTPCLFYTPPPPLEGHLQG